MTHREDLVSGADHQDRHGLVNEGQRSVLQLSTKNTFRVHVGQLFDFLGEYKANKLK